MKRKAISLVLAAAMAATLAGCGGSSTAATSAGEAADTAAASETAAAEDTADTAEATASGDVKEISLWHYFEGVDGPMMDELCDRYNEAHPDVHITATYVARAELMKQYTVGAVSGDLPDIGMVDSPDMASFITLGIFEDITEELEAWGELDNFYPGPLSSTVDADGRRYGLPQNTNCLALGVNMDVLAAAGYDHVPTSQEEFMEMVAATTDEADSTFGYAMSLNSNEEGTFQLMPWLLATHDGNQASLSDLTGTGANIGLQMVSDFVNAGYMSKECVNWTQADVYNQFVAGKAAMAMLGTWHLSTLEEEVGDSFNYQIALLPTGDEGTSSSTIGGENFAVCTGTEYREEAIEFLEFLCSAEENAAWAEGIGKIPVRSDAVANYDHDQDSFAVFVDEMNYALARGPHAEWPTISEAIYTCGQDVVVNGTSADEALQKAADSIAPILEANPLP